MLENLLMFSIDNKMRPTRLGGGWYVGIIVVGGKNYALILSPKDQGQSPVTIQWKTTATANTGALSINDGLENTQTLINSNSVSYPAAKFCNDLTIGGYSDWYLPSMDELEMCYRVFKPANYANSLSGTFSKDGKAGLNLSSIPNGPQYTASDPAQTIYPDFISGASESFSEGYYWTSTNYDSTRARSQSFSNGYQSVSTKNGFQNVRAVRRQLL